MRMARDGESLAALNGKTYALTPEDGIIADAAGPEALGGIIGGTHSGCDEGTTEVFIECALFDPVRIALSGRRHDVRTDARPRFERGIDPALLPAWRSSLATRADASSSAAARRARSRPPAPSRPGSATRRCASSGWPGSAAPTCRRTRRSASSNASASR